jgi:hypothetical protein
VAGVSYTPLVHTPPAQIRPPPLRVGACATLQLPPIGDYWLRGGRAPPKMEGRYRVSGFYQGDYSAEDQGFPLPLYLCIYNQGTKQ